MREPAVALTLLSNSFLFVFQTHRSLFVLSFGFIYFFLFLLLTRSFGYQLLLSRIYEDLADLYLFLFRWRGVHCSTVARGPSDGILCVDYA